MHFVTGGAFNGKSKWVRAYYQLDDTPHEWFSAYDQQAAPFGQKVFQERIIVVEGIEAWIKNGLDQPDLNQTRNKWRRCIQSWLEWEQEYECRNIIMIGTDISKGIVPINEEDRKWRDLTGWIYQDIAQAAERMDVVWYGLNKKLK